MSSPTAPTPSGPRVVTSVAPHLFDETDSVQAIDETHELPRRKLRVLCLRGFRTNAKVMLNQTKGLRAAMGDDAEFIFLDAPFPAVGPTDPVIERLHGQDAPFYEWWYGKAIKDIAKDETKWRWSHDNASETLAFMDQKLSEIGPVDVAVGFSQGSNLLTVLTMRHLQAKKEVPWKLCVCVGGVAVGSIQFRDLMETPNGRSVLVPFPSIHIIGRKDPLHKMSLRLVDQYDSHTTVFPASPLKKMVVFHDEGHKFPSLNKHKALYDELAQRIYDHCHACDEGDVGKQNHAFARL